MIDAAISGIGRAVQIPFQGRRHIPRQRHRVTNWRDYDTALRNRGSLTIWFTDEALAGWKAQPRTTPGGPSGVSIGAAPERRVDWLDHANVGDRPARP